jgi:hypothetical protein
MQESRNLTYNSMKKLRNMMLLDEDYPKILMLQSIWTADFLKVEELSNGEYFIT